MGAIAHLQLSRSYTIETKYEYQQVLWHSSKEIKTEFENAIIRFSMIWSQLGTFHLFVRAIDSYNYLVLRFYKDKVTLCKFEQGNEQILIGKFLNSEGNYRFEA